VHAWHGDCARAGRCAASLSGVILFTSNADTGVHPSLLRTNGACPPRRYPGAALKYRYRRKFGAKASAVQQALSSRLDVHQGSYAHG
jgi:hypothetical protein